MHPTALTKFRYNGAWNISKVCATHVKNTAYAISVLICVRWNEMPFQFFTSVKSSWDLHSTASRTHLCKLHHGSFREVLSSLCAKGKGTKFYSALVIYTKMKHDRQRWCQGWNLSYTRMFLIIALNIWDNICVWKLS